MKYKNGSLESSVLNAMWDMEREGNYKNSVKEVYDYLAKSEKTKRAYTTIKTVMDRLWDKELVLRIKFGKKFYYRTATSSAEIIEDSLKKIAHQYCGGDMSKLMKYTQSLCNNSVISA